MSKLRTKIIKKILRHLLQKPRIIKYKFLSDNKSQGYKPKIFQPINLMGKGSINFGKNAAFGCYPSAFLYSGYIYIEARTASSSISFGNNIHINNNCVFISAGEGIDIGEKCLIGSGCEFYDSDFHEINPATRHSGKAKTAKISIGKNVFIGANSTILKGVTIGDNSVIGAGSVVTKSIPSNVIAAGNPAKVIRKI